MRLQRAQEGFWFRRLDGALQSWLLPRACVVSPGRLVNPDVLHGSMCAVLFGISFPGRGALPAAAPAAGM